MATPFEGLMLLENFSFIFPFLLVFVVTFAILSMTKVFGGNKSIDAMVSLVIAVMLLFSPLVRNTITTAAPWFVLLFFFIIFAIIAVKIFGFSNDSIMSAVSGDFRYVIWWVIALCIIIGVGSLTYVVSNAGGIGAVDGETTAAPSDGSVASGDQTGAFWATLVHPKVLGMILILLIAMTAIIQLTR